MQFIVKDLMISVLPLRPSGTVAPGGAAADCLCTGCTGCTGNTKQTKGPVCGVDFDLFGEISNPAPLAVLKQQLREALAAVEAREKVVYESMQPKSQVEVDLLQAHLTAALQELKQRGGGQGSTKASA